MEKNSIQGFLSREGSLAFWDQYWFDYAEKVIVKCDAAHIIEKLKYDGNHIILITARTYDSQLIKYGVER